MSALAGCSTASPRALALPVQGLRFSGGWVRLPALAGLRTVRLAFRFFAGNAKGSRAEFLLDLDPLNNSYSVARDASYGEFGGIEANFAAVWDNAQPYQVPSQTQGGKLAFSPFEDGILHTLTLELEAPLSTPRAYLLTQYDRGGGYYYDLFADLGRVELYDRVLTAAELSAPEAAPGALAVYRGQLTPDHAVLLDESGHGRHAQLGGPLPELL